MFVDVVLVMNRIVLGKGVSAVHLLSNLTITSIHGFEFMMKVPNMTGIVLGSLSLLLLLVIGVGVSGIYSEKRNRMIVYGYTLPVMAIRDLFYVSRAPLMFTCTLVSLICVFLVPFALSKVVKFYELGNTVSIVHTSLQMLNGRIALSLLTSQIFSDTAAYIVIPLLIGLVWIFVPFGISGFFIKKRYHLIIYAVALPLIATIDSIAISLYLELKDSSQFLFILAPIAGLVFDLAAAFTVYSYLFNHRNSPQMIVESL